jgi:hypothetical protein
MILVLIVSIALLFQIDKPQPDRWRGLVLDQSSPSDAMRILGSPKKDKEGSVRTYPLNKRLEIDHNSKNIRKLTFEKLEGVKTATLLFKDSKLVLIELELDKKIPASNLAGIYDREFVPKVSEIETSFSPGSYERHEGKVYPKKYPLVYYLIARSENSYVSAMVENSVVGHVFLGATRGQAGADDRGGFPGKVSRVQIVSRSVENRAGFDVLK